MKYSTFYLNNKFSRSLRTLFTFSLITFLFNGHLHAQNESDVLRNKWLQHSDASNSLYHHLTGEAFQLLDSREEKTAQLLTPAEWRQRQEQIKQAMWDAVGSFPGKTPLNPKTTGKIVKEGYSIENVVYESLPGFYVTASLFIPDNIKKPAPAILFCSGHSSIAYRRPLYQLPLLNLVKKGFVVLAIDPIGQGERLQYYDRVKGESVIGSSTKEHSYPSVQVSLIGQSIARYFIWDGIRGIDYLVSRKEVDPDRIGVHGLSGGGTQTAYISALDDRVLASAPAGYITSYRRLLESIGVQDGEQNFYHGLLTGIDHADFIEARAPKPTLIMATTGDFFSIQGVRETFKELKRVYQIFGKSDHIELVEDDDEHNYTQKNREAMYAFFLKHLAMPGKPDEEEVEYLDEEELQKTTTGQLSTSLGGATVFSLNRSESERYVNEQQNARVELKKHLPQALISAKQLSGYKEPYVSDEPVFTGRVQNEGYAIEKYFVKGEGNYVVPYLLLVPDNPNNKAVVYLHPKGKAGAMEENNETGWLAGQGFTVLVPDLLGTGELGGGDFKGDANIGDISYNMWFTSMLIGRSIVGIQASDVVKLSLLLQQKNRVEHVFGIAREEMSPVLLHAAAFNTVISRVALIEPYSSYRSFVMNRFYDPQFVHSLVPGALTAYDLPDLAATLAPVKLLIAGMTDANRQTNEEEISKDLKVIEDAYQLINAGNQLEVVKQRTIIDSPDVLFREWVK